MSNHRKPLSELERLGLEAHGLGRHIGKPSQLADAFRHGIAWALANAAPPAQTPYLRVIDEELVGAHLDVANETDTYTEAKAKVNKLIAWHIHVATDPAVNGGFELKPAQTPLTYAPNTDEPRHTLPDQAPIPVVNTAAQTPPPNRE